VTSTDQTPESDVPDTRSMTRRTLLGGAAGGLGLLLPGALIVRAQYDHDDDDEDREDEDNSGPGSDIDDKLDDDGHDHHDDDGAADDDEECREPGDDNDDRADCAAAPGEVHIGDDDADGFNPGTITVAVGDTVTWFNDDDKQHTATGGDWDTGPIEPGESASVTFDEPGEFAYACQFHPVMAGKVVVTADGTPVASPVASPEASPATAVVGEVTIFNLAYDPASIEVPAGTTVTWRNDDQVPHTATGKGGVFDTGTIDAGGTGTFTFDTPGTFEYGCAFHPGMSGTVVVT
jgi:plastocyanin